MSRPPRAVRFRPGERISYEGSAFTFDGADVTENVTFDVDEGSVWGASQKARLVTASYVDSLGEKHKAQLVLRRRRPVLPIAAGVLVLLAATGLATAAWWQAQPKGDTGIRAASRDNGSQGAAGPEVPANRITVSVSSAPELTAAGKLRVNFAVVEDNGFAERLTVEQFGEVVGQSGVVQPGDSVEWIDAPQAAAGKAKVIVHAVGEDGSDVGSPASVEVDIVAGAAND